MTHQDNAVSAVPVPLRYRQQLRLWTNNAVNNMINQKHLWILHNIKHLELWNDYNENNILRDYYTQGSKKCLLIVPDK